MDLKGFDLMAGRAATALSRQTRKLLVCAGTGCVAGGALRIHARLQEMLKARGLQTELILDHHDHDAGNGALDCDGKAPGAAADAHPVNGVGLKKSGCHGFCEMGPLLRVEPENWLYVKVTEADCEEIIEKTVLCGQPVVRLLYTTPEGVFAEQEEIPFYKRQTRVVLEHCGSIDAESLTEYLAKGGYAAFKKALLEMTPEGICREISASNLRGRGGGGYPAGRKWQQVLRNDSDVKYVVCNGDEGDPGAFMDRSIMEGDPHRVLEGMLIAALAVRATEGFLYVRAEYPLAIARLEHAIHQARACGLLGENILGSGLCFDLRISRGAGRVCLR